MIGNASPEQLLRFVEHLFAAHSWYKHLPLGYPGKEFHFWLSSQAGYLRYRSGDAEISRPRLIDDCWHYSQVTTLEYQRRYGNIEYSVGKLPEPVAGEERRYLGCWSFTAFIHERAANHRVVAALSRFSETEMWSALSSNESALSISSTDESWELRCRRIRAKSIQQLAGALETWQSASVA